MVFAEVTFLDGCCSSGLGYG